MIPLGERGDWKLTSIAVEERTDRVGACTPSGAGGREGERKIQVKE